MNKREEKKFYKHVGARMKARRAEVGLTQEEVAKKLKLTRISIVNIESGRHHAKFHNLVHIAKLLDVSVIYFLP